MRLAQLADLDRLQALEALFPSDAMSRRSLRRFVQISSARFLVAEVDHQVQANLLLLIRRGSPRARIYSLVVDPAARGLGLAQALVREAEAVARSSGCKEVSLEVRVDNHAAQALYAKLGYAQAGTLSGYYDDGADGLRLSKILAHS